MTARRGEHSGRLAAAFAIAVWLASATGAAATAPTTPTTKTAANPAVKAPTGPSRPPTTAAPPRTTPTKKATSRAAARAPGRPPLEQARGARELDDIGAYARAAEILKTLRARVKLDGDLELALALDEARTGRIDSAVVRLSGLTLTAAAADSLPPARRREYPYTRELAWMNGRFDGWHWYVVRARAELAALQGRWTDALAAARQCVEARPLSGKDWAILSVCAARAGEPGEARHAAEQALALDPTLPEAYHLAGLWAWRDGRRNDAVASFRQAVALDSSYRAAALALIRARLPGTAPDSLPVELLNGIRRVALLTSPEGPKPEEFVQMDVSAIMETSPDSAVVDSIRPGVKPLQLVLSVLVDENGRAVLSEVPWYPPTQLDFRKVTRILASVPGWRFRPAERLGRPHRVWVSLDYYLNP